MRTVFAYWAGADRHSDAHRTSYGCAFPAGLRLLATALKSRPIQ